LRSIADSDVHQGTLHVGAARPATPFALANETVAQPRPTLQAAGRYRILRPYARGGLGEVFVAEDTELGRHIALKEIQAQHADRPEYRKRFVVEAEITGGLEHPGIVPVYGLGTYADGRPFYAMRFIKGDNLRDAIRRFHESEAGDRRRFTTLAFRELLGRFVDVCQAVAYAHSRGVLHRDLKPGNVMLGKYGETLVVDWGLAKSVGRTVSVTSDSEATLLARSGGESSQTIAGQALGTPAYMAPEQAAGRLDELGPAADVYSLGATLYELLTGRVAMPNADLATVQRGDFPPPRTVMPSVPRPLEAVCLKAMSLRPSDRYPTAQRLAADIEHWLADEPVAAYREPVAVRVRRWGRRHRVLVTGAAAAGLVALAGLAVVLGVQSKANRDLRAANERETARFDLAMDAIKVFHGEVSEDLLLKEKQFKGLRGKLLRGAADFYCKLEGLLRGQADRRSRAALGRADFELAELTSKIGSKPSRSGGQCWRLSSRSSH
jgi:serine/threonine-protein kinase